MDLDEKKRLWEDYIHRGVIGPEVNRHVALSWMKCSKKKVDPYGGMGRKTDPELLKSIREENQWLIDIAGPIMRNLFDIVSGSHFLLVLTDSCGYILETIGDDAVNRMAQEMHFEVGMLWNDDAVGTNAIGVALDQDVQIQMAGAEHFCITHHKWTCSASPIHGLNGEVVGCLNISGDASMANSHSLGIVAAAAFGIENQILQRHTTGLMRTALDSSSDGIVILDESFRSVWMNKAAENILFMGLSELSGIDFRSLMPDMPWGSSEKSAQGKRHVRNDCKLILGSMTYQMSASISPIIFERSTIGYSVSMMRQEQLLKTVNKVTGNHATYTFDDIYAMDPVMKRVIQMAQKYSKYDGNILIEGESGTGKELFAQAIHNASARADAPFITINCASIPRDLVESELFGYEKGAFTGALKEGKPGKFELADGGTIFLDEIGEMPLEFQPKLLRIVQSRCVQRLGGKFEKKLDIRIIVATNRNLKDEVAARNFREDLYFRFNVLKLTIPPLRDRKKDIAYCAEKFLEHFNRRYPEISKEMDGRFLRALEGHYWPGNVRELQNCIERAFYTGTGNMLTDASSYFDSIDESKTISPRQERPLNGTLDELEGKNVENVLKNCRGDVCLAAEKLGISRASMYRRLKKYGISPKDASGRLS